MFDSYRHLYIFYFWSKLKLTDLTSKQSELSFAESRLENVNTCRVTQNNETMNTKTKKYFCYSKQLIAGLSDIIQKFLNWKMINLNNRMSNLGG